MSKLQKIQSLDTRQQFEEDTMNSFDECHLFSNDSKRDVLERIIAAAGHESWTSGYLVAVILLLDCRF